MPDRGLQRRSPAVGIRCGAGTSEGGSRAGESGGRSIGMTEGDHEEYEPLRREYSRLASRYDTRWRSYVEASVRETLRRAQVMPGERVLDVGCGTGVLLEELSSRAPRASLAGVDLSEEMLEVARRRLGAAIELRLAPAEVLPFADATLDVVVSTNVFHYIRHPRSALCEMHRVLKRGGRVLITDWCDDYLACRVCDVFLRAFHRAHVRTYGSEECRQLLTRAGFASPDVGRYRISRLWGLMTATARKDARPKDGMGPRSFDRGEAKRP